MKKLKSYPKWVCSECGVKAIHKAGYNLSSDTRSTFHYDYCDVCGKMRAVTEPRDYKYPSFEGHEKP